MNFVKKKVVSRVEKYIKALEGISYYEWIKLRIAIDRAFEIKKSELEKNLKFADIEGAKNIIRSQFE